jgi:hypothetical protein
MKHYLLLLAALTASLQSCNGPPTLIPTSKSATAASPNTQPATINATLITAKRSDLGTLPLLENPPVTPRFPLTPLYTDVPRRYLAVDLNGNGHLEFFVEQMNGTHSIEFALIDSQGDSLLPKRDDNVIGGDRLLVLTTSHHGYSDLISSSCDLSTVNWNKWTFDGKRYVPSRMFTYIKSRGSTSFFLEDTLGKVRESWYADVWSLSPGMRDRLISRLSYPSTNATQ